MSRRFWLMVSSWAASEAASVASLEMSRLKATSTSPMRPAAFRRGTSENGRPSASICERSQLATAASATMPGRCVWRMRSMPSVTRARFSRVRFIMSEMVPSVATSV